MKEDKCLDKLGYYEMYVGDDFNLLTTDHIIDILNSRLYRDLPLDLLRVIYAELKYSKNLHDEYRKYGELNTDKIDIEYYSSDTNQEKKYEIGKENSHRLAYLKDEVYLDFYTEYVNRVNIHINNFYMYSNVYQDDPMLEYQTYIKFIHEDVMWYLGKEEAKKQVNVFHENTLNFLKSIGFTGEFENVYQEMYDRYMEDAEIYTDRKWK